MKIKIPSILIALVTLAGSLMIAGCSKSELKVEMKSSAFDSAPGELKQLWDNAAGKLAGKDYVGAAEALVSLQDRSATMTEEQQAAVKVAWNDLGNYAFKAANEGDNGALAAVQLMRNSKYGDGNRR